MDLLESKLKKKFLHHILFVHNLFHILTSTFYLCFAINMAACLWISLGILEDGWVKNRSWIDEDCDPVHVHELTENGFFHIYWNSVYFVVTTMTTVGYGDMSAWSSQGDINDLDD